jgi:transposase
VQFQQTQLVKKKREQEEFLENELNPRLQEAKEGKRKVFFVDASHMVWGAFLGYIWCYVRLFIPTPSGRKRFNVLGALDSITHELIQVCNETYINAQSVCELLMIIAEKNYRIPITLVMDNAKYQRCTMVKELAEKLNIEILYLPSYSPQLNIIERLWKWIKKDCLYCKYYDCFNNFKSNILMSLDKIHIKQYKEEMDSLLNLKFQVFNKTQIMTV